MHRTRLIVAVVSIGGLAATALVAAPTVGAVPPPFTPVVTGLVNPTHLSFGRGGLYIADIGTASITRHNLATGASSTVASGDGFVAGVDVRRGDGAVFWTLNQSASPETPGPTFVYRTKGATTKQVADPFAWEIAHNPDGQNPNAPDSRSNPYSLLALGGDRVIIADAGANDLLMISGNHVRRTLTVFPTFTNPGCGTNNNGEKSCDPVPTDVELGPDGYLYVSGLGAEVEGHVYKVDPRTGAIVRTWSGLPPLTGIAVAPDGTIYVASLIAGFGPSTSTVLKISGDTVTSTFVPVPTDVEWHDGALYAASFAGAVFRVDLASFHP